MRQDSETVGSRQYTVDGNFAKAEIAKQSCEARYAGNLKLILLKSVSQTEFNPFGERLKLFAKQNSRRQ